MPSWSLNHFHGAFLPPFLWPVILLRLALSPYWVDLRNLPRVRAHLSAKVDSSEEAYGELTSLTMGCRPLPF